MAKLGARIWGYPNGQTLLSLNFVAVRSGGTNDNCQMRCVRRYPGGGYADKVLVGTAEFVLRAENDSYSWQWIDDDVPASGYWDYYLQIKKIDGNGSFFEMMFTALHFKR